jgi:hypothetical protein
MRDELTIEELNVVTGGDKALYGGSLGGIHWETYPGGEALVFWDGNGVTYGVSSKTGFFEI